MEAICVWSGVGLILILTDRLFCTNLKGKGTCLQCSLVSWLQVPLTIFSIVIVAVMTLKGALSMSHALQPMKKSALHFVARVRCVCLFISEKAKLYLIVQKDQFQQTKLQETNHHEMTWFRMLPMSEIWTIYTHQLRSCFDFCPSTYCLSATWIAARDNY